MSKAKDEHLLAEPIMMQFRQRHQHRLLNALPEGSWGLTCSQVPQAPHEHLLTAGGIVSWQ